MSLWKSGFRRFILIAVVVVLLTELNPQPLSGQVISPTVAGSYDLTAPKPPAGRSSAAGLLEPLPSYCQPKLLRGDASLLAVSFRDEKRGLACGDFGVILRTDDGGQSWSSVESGTDVTLNDIVWTGHEQAVAVGGRYDCVTAISRGVIVRTRDGGRSWSTVNDDELPGLHSVRLHDRYLQAEGDWSYSLLTDQIESRDGGQQWQGAAPRDPRSIPVLDRSTGPAKVKELIKWAKAIGAPVAIRDACRVGRIGICAVGDHGAIVMSDDRGQSWRWQRGEGRRSAVLIVASDPASACWSILGNEVLENRHRTSLLFAETGASGSSPSPLNKSFDPSSEENRRRCRQAATMLGASGTDNLLTSWAAASTTDLQEEAASWIRIHAPAVVLLDHRLPQALKDAFFQAATSKGVTRVAEYGGDRGYTVLHRDALLAGVGALASDLEADALMLVAPERMATESVSLRSLYDIAASGRRGDSVCDGLTLLPGQRMAASLPTAPRRRLQTAQARMQQTQRVQELLHASQRSLHFDDALTRLIDQTAREDQLRLLWTLSVQTNDRNRRQVILRQIGKRFSDHSVGRFAKLKLRVPDYSHEWAQLQAIGGPDSGGEVAVAAATSPPISPFQAASPALGELGVVQQASAISPLVVPDRSSTQSEARIEETATVDLAWEFHPLRLIAQDAQRRSGEDGELLRANEPSANLQRLIQSAKNPWSELLSGAGKPIEARRCEYPPRLDGVLDEDCWHTAMPHAGQVSRLQLSYDDDYLYAALQWDAKQFRPDPFAKTATVQRDHNLSSTDRLRLRFDLDRDLLAPMQLHVSDAGRTRDQIDNEASWQPTWYVATKRDQRWVTIELAIWRRDLIDLPLVPGQSWYASLELVKAGNESTQAIIPNPGKWLRVDFR